MTAPRTVRLRARRDLPAALPNDARVLVPSARAAAAWGVPARTLAGEAARDLAAAGVRPAPPLRRWRALGRAVAEALPDADPGPWRRALAGPVRDLLRAGAPGAPEPDGLSLASRRALAVARRYRDALAADGAIDPAEAFAAAARVAVRREAPWVVAAPARMDGPALAYLDAAAAPGSTVLVPPEGEAWTRALVALGWEAAPGVAPPEARGERWAARFLTGREDGAGGVVLPRALGFASQDEALRWALARSRDALAGGTPPERVLLVARDPAALAPRVEALAWELDVRVRPSSGRPLAATPGGAFLTTLVEVVTRGAPYEPTLRLLRHRLGATDGLDLAEARAARPEGPAAWAAVDPRAAVLAWPARDRRAAYGERLAATLARLGVPRGDADEADRAAVRLALRGAAEACEPPAERVSLRTFLTDVADLLDLLVAPDPGPDGPAVDLVAPDEAAGAAVDHLFVLDAVEGTLPAPIRDDPVLDFADRARFASAGVALRGAADRARDEEAAFAQVLRAARGEAWICVPSHARGKAALASPYLARLGVRIEAPPPRPPGSPEERRRARLLAVGDGLPGEPGDPVLAAARRALAVERSREGAGAPDAYDGVTGRPSDPARLPPFSATRLVDLGQCPFRWFARHRLGLRDADEPDEVVDPRLRGILWHATLEGAVREALASVRGEGDDATAVAGDALRAATLAAVPAAFEAAEAEARVPDTAAWRRVRGGEIRAVERLVRSDAFLTEGRTPVALEASFEGDFRGLPVRGVVDRVDAGPDGVELIDYKSGGSKPKGARRASGRGWLDVQLPLYLEAAADVVAPGRPARGARYLSVRAAATVGTVEPGADDAALGELVQRVRGHLAAGAYPVAPDERREVCRLCDLGPVCRVGPRVERKRDAAAAREARDADDAPSPGAAT